MGFFKTPLEKELAALEKREAKLRAERIAKKDGKLTEFLATRVPTQLQSTLDAAFARAFGAIFEKGTPLIELTYSKSAREKEHQIKLRADELYRSRKTLRAFSKTAKASSRTSLAISGVAGVGMGLFGIGIPDIPVFAGMLLRCIYGIAVDFGFDYSDERERYFILLLIEAGIARGEEFYTLDKRIDELISSNLSGDFSISEQIPKTSAILSGELLYMKFLQGVPIVGAVGGAYDAIYVKSIGDYARLKYQKRFLLRHPK